MNGSNEDDEETLLSDNAFEVTTIRVLAHHLSPQLSPPTDYLIQIATKEHPNASPFHFWIGEAQLRQIVA